jgi:hypothetical protein
MSSTGGEQQPDALAPERDLGGCYRCSMCGTRAVPEDPWTFVAARHARPRPRLLPVCWRCWFVGLAAFGAGGTY